ncbi:F-box/LRR-repeat protein 6 [Poecilia latipinna]|uniref:F-box and leucine rich repeat protein 6 n=2 Tax=Poecilia TaxID=8080 RepID=A0A087Y6A2_POEFO|nr:PREDICTED: F-box/LRR-repeat protein 6 [Poecilia formosa]XP_014875698.1 PREDICTED: F-box/LRR-repeat protein 6 [Poecilia latipinna]XP_014875699.1 PREDICTED: F-box/LRR-repeat protein 6 [Poecilia latipinna]XP_016521083.1 PREDICTED: F-box/LRR-repeat protein 6 [Poecilia formosa]
MDASAQSGGTGGGGTGGDATARKPTPKRKEGEKARKAKRARVSRPAFTIQQGEDMLLYISNTSSQSEGLLWTSRRKNVSKAKLLKNQKKKKKTVCSKSRLKRKTVKEEEEDRFPEEDRWGQLLPEEVLVNIFQMLVVQDGAVPFLCRVSRVCRLWNAAAATLTLWRKVVVSHCWIQPARGQTEKTSNRIKETFTWLAQNRFSQLSDFTLCHWATSVDFALETVSEFCPHLRSVHLSYCRGVTGSGLRSLGLHSRNLQRLNLQHSEFQVEGLVDFLEEHGKQIRQMLFTRSHRNDKVLAAIAKGFCPDLELLEVNKKLDSKDTELSVCFQSLQKACPKLKIFRMFNIQIQHKAMRKRGESEAGFPLLDEFCIANTEYSYMTDQVLLDVLFGSTRLRVLDLRGSTRITTFGLAQLPCPKLECLFWGQYFTKNIGFTSVKKNLQLLMEKWGPTLQQLDITNQPFTEADLEVALAFLAQVAEADMLLSLNLSGTKITAQALRPVVERMTSLGYLNLSSCRNLPRGVKKIYRSQEEIQELLTNLH